MRKRFGLFVVSGGLADLIIRSIAIVWLSHRMCHGDQLPGGSRK